MGEGPLASDDERENVVVALQRHYAEGRLTREEFDDRLDRVLSARSLSELYAVTSDLPVLTVVDVPHLSVHTDRRRRWWRC